MGHSQSPILLAALILGPSLGFTVTILAHWPGPDSRRRGRATWPKIQPGAVPTRRKKRRGCDELNDSVCKWGAGAGAESRGLQRTSLALLAFMFPLNRQKVKADFESSQDKYTVKLPPKMGSAPKLGGELPFSGKL